MVDFMRVKYENPKLKQSEIASRLGYFSLSPKEAIKMIYICFHPIEYTQIKQINEQKRLKKQNLTIIHIMTMRSKDLK